MFVILNNTSSTSTYFVSVQKLFPSTPQEKQNRTISNYDVKSNGLKTGKCQRIGKKLLGTRRVPERVNEAREEQYSVCQVG